MQPPYSEYYKTILMDGRQAAPRGLAVRELANYRVRFSPGEMLRRAGGNHRIGIMEGLMFVAGEFSREWVAAVAPRARLDLFTEQAAYGPRSRDQMPLVERELRRDPLSRRAQVILARPAEVGTADLPCTTDFTFTLRNGLLSATFTMRSSDAAWGLQYDITQFGMIVQALASVLGATPAMCVINIANAHIYEDQADQQPVVSADAFRITARLGNWYQAQTWALAQCEAYAAGRPLVGLEVHHAT